MHGKRKLVLWAVVFALALPLMYAGIAGAAYLPDGATQDPTSGGWDLPQDMGVCVTGIQADGTLVTDPTIHSDPDCLAKTWPAYTTKAACGSTSNAEGAAHFWGAGCIADDGTPISLKNLDRNAAMCNQAAIAAGKASGTWYDGRKTFTCTSSWQYAGADATYSNGSYVSGGFDQGFCYAKVDVTSAYSTQAACVGYNSYATPNLNNWKSNACTYNFGVNGGLVSSASGTIVAMDGTNTVTPGSTIPDLTGMTMGQCLLAGYSWNNYYIKSGTTSMAGGTVATIASGGNVNCLRCHSSVSQYTSVAEHWKESYLKQGHKNMLRAVTAGKVWGGPDDNGNMVTYDTTGWANGTLDFAGAMSACTSTAMNNGKYICSTDGGTTLNNWNYPLLYIFGDWMAAAPGGLDVVVNTPSGMKYNATGQYSCTPCHTTGYYQPNAGLCSLSHLTTEATCTAGGGTWYPSVGYQGAFSNGLEPQATYPTVTNNYGNWDQNGIMCSRCHQATLPEVYDSTNSAYSGNGHDWGTAIESGSAITNMCVGCHQATAKTANGTGADVDLNNPATPGLNATSNGFTGHPIGEWFLNSPHSRYTGTMVPNALGKYDIGVYSGNAFNAYGTFNTAFNDGFCKGQSTYVDANGNPAEIKTQADCALAGGSWTYRPDQGSCTSCHDVHNSLFEASEGEKALKKECEDCHTTATAFGTTANKTAPPTVDLTLTSHPAGSNTPFDQTRFASPCETCHMPADPGTKFAMHLWRINTDPTYSTFPSAAQVAGGQKLANTSPDVTSNGTYTSAIWVDLDLACGQCHEASGLNYVSGNPLLTKDQLAIVAAGIHTGATGTAISDGQCLSCHSTQQGTYDAVIQSGASRNHHQGSCGECHGTTQWPLHKGIMTFGNPTYSGGLDTPLTGCLACHDGRGGTAAVYNNIIPDGTSDNHHSDHGSCTTCHGPHGGMAPNNAGKSLAVDGGGFCLTCHGNTGNYAKHHAVQSIVDAGMDCLTCHTGSAGVPGAMSYDNGGCLICHGTRAWTASTGETLRVVKQGVNHHNGECITCHYGEPFAVLATGNLSSKGTVSVKTPITDSGNSVFALCLSCHSNTQTRSSDGATLSAITPTSVAGGVSDNHHQGHGNNDSDPMGYYCLACHGQTTVDGSHKILASGLTVTATSSLKSFVASTVSGGDPVSNLCIQCHGSVDGGYGSFIQSGPNRNHHAGSCLTCHQPDKDGGPGITTKATSTTTISWKPPVVPGWDTCTACHSSTPTPGAPVAPTINQGVNHHSGACDECHLSTPSEKGTRFSAGVPAMPAPNYTLITDSKGKVGIDTSIQTSCLTCHSKVQTRSSDLVTLPAITISGAGDNHHNGHDTIPVAGSTDPGLYCLGCHGAVSVVAPTAGSTYKITASGLPPAAASTLKGMVPNANNTPGINAVSTLCVQCHSNVDTGHGSIVQEGASKNHHSGDCLNCHVPDQLGGPGVTSDATGSPSKPSTIPSWVDCSQCHGATPKAGTIQIIQTGATQNHHQGTCDTCHAAPGVPATTQKNPTYNSTSRVDTPGTGCLYCHGPASTSASTLHVTSANYPNGIVPDSNTPGFGDNHHSDHGTCTQCHGADGGVLPSVISAQNGYTGGADATSSLCLSCHGRSIVQSGATQNHHTGTCLTCHQPGQTGGPGITSPYKPSTIPSWVDCSACHDSGTLATLGTATNGPSSAHHIVASYATCDTCHTNAGVRPKKVDGTVKTQCTDCHTETLPNMKSTSVSVTSCADCHTQGGLKPVIPDVCLGCHTGQAAFKLTPTNATTDAKNLHKAVPPKTAFTWAADTKTNLKVNYKAGAVTCPTGNACTYEWSFGDGSLASNSTKTPAISHTFATAGTYTTSLVVTTGSLNGRSKPYTAKATAKYVVTTTPVTVNMPAALNATGYTLNIPSISAIVGGGTGAVTVVITWGDLNPATGLPYKTKVTLGVGSDSLTHVYKKPGAYTMIMVAKDAGVTIGGKTFVSKVKTTTKVTVLRYYIAGTVTDQNNMPVAGVVLILKQGTTKRLSASSNILGQYLFSNVKPEALTSKATTSYSIVVTKAGYSFGTNNVYTFDGNPNPVIAPDRSSQFIFQDVKGNKL